jgi:hypothetical protein
MVRRAKRATAFATSGPEKNGPEKNGPETSGRGMIDRVKIVARAKSATSATSDPEKNVPATSGPEMSGPEMSGPEMSGPEMIDRVTNGRRGRIAYGMTDPGRIGRAKSETASASSRGLSATLWPWSSLRPSR